MLIAHITTRLINGGADENIVACSNWSAANGHEVVLVHGRETQPEILAKVSPGVRLREVPALVRRVSPRTDAAALLALRRLFAALKPDVVHTHTSKAGILGRFAARQVRVPRIVHGVHIAPFLGVSPVEAQIYLAAERIVAAWTHAFVDVSEAMKRLYVEARIGPEDRHHVVRSGMDLSAFRQPRPIVDWRRLLGIGEAEPKPPVVLMLAAFEPRKRHAEFIRAFEAVLSAVPSARLVLAGGGDPHHPSIEAAVAQSTRPENIRRLGFHANPGGLIALADIGVLCSTNEGLPRVVIQYLAGGLPVVVSDMPGIAEAVAHDRNGLITDANDLSGSANAIASLLLDRGRLAALSAGAWQTDVSPWSIDRMCRNNDSVYTRLAHATVH